MAYDEELADRIRESLESDAGVREKKMFGGLAFLVHGNMAIAASGQGGLLVRVDPAGSDELITATGARRFEMGGREMRGWLRVDADRFTPDADLDRWVAVGVAFARSLSPKR